MAKKNLDKNTKVCSLM